MEFKASQTIMWIIGLVLILGGVVYFSFKTPVLQEDKTNNEPAQVNIQVKG